MSTAPPTGENADQEFHRRVKDHIQRYMIAVHGRNVGFRAPETFDNLVERWMVFLSGDSFDLAEETIATIERMAAERRG